MPEESSNREEKPKSSVPDAGKMMERTILRIADMKEMVDRAREINARLLKMMPRIEEGDASEKSGEDGDRPPDSKQSPEP